MDISEAKVQIKKNDQIAVVYKLMREANVRSEDGQEIRRVPRDYRS